MLLTILVVPALVAVLFASVPAVGSGGGVGTPGASTRTLAEGELTWRQRVNRRFAARWAGLPNAERRWAYRVSECESGGYRAMHGGGGYYHGAFMFLISSWRSSPGSPGGDPHRWSWKTQAVVSVWLKRQLGTKPWPVCG